MKRTTYSAIFGTILLVVAMTVKLSGCKDKAEAYELIDPNDCVDLTISSDDITLFTTGETTYTDVQFCYSNSLKGIDEELTLNIVDNEIVCSQPPEKAVEIIFKSLYVGYGIGMQTDVDELTVRFPEPNEPNDVIILKGKRRAWQEEGWNRIEFTPEPNELGCKHENRITCAVYGCGCWSCIDCPERSPIDRPELTLNITEPNEPETTNWIYIADLDEPKKVSLDFIPTWPDYIELEKDLVIENFLNYKFDGTRVYRLFTLRKGTKIYFKD